MKLTAGLLLLTLLQVSAKTFSQTVTLKGHRLPLEQVFDRIKDQTGYAFVYDANLIKKASPLEIDIKNMPLATALTLIGKGQPFTCEIRHKIIVVKENPAIVTASSATTPVLLQSISGKVLDEKGNAVENATVTLLPGAKGALTDAKGAFTIHGIMPGNYTLRVTFIGFAPHEQKITVNKDLTGLQVTLKTSSSSLNDIVIVGYGATKKSDLTGSVGSVTADQITQVNAVSNVSQALQGQVAGVQVNQASGQPGEFMRIKIRGTTSIGASSSPLYVVDGLPLDDLSAQLNPDDIERMEVLKDASATAIYGSRGANGVVMITTKRGKTGKARVSYSGYYGIQQLRKKINLVNAREFAALQNEVAKNDGTPLPWTAAQIDSLSGKGNDWQDLVYRKAPVQDHNISISGGNENTRYFTSFGYFNQQGIIDNSSFKRFSFRTNLDQKLSDRFNITSNLSLQQSRYAQAQYQGAEGGGGVPWTTMVIPPTQPVYNPDGSYTRFTGVPWGESNPVGISRELYQPSSSMRIIGNVALNYNIAPGLVLKLSGGIDKNDTKEDYYAPGTITIGRGTDKDGNPISGVARKNYYGTFTFINENTLSYNRTFGSHTIDAVGGITYQQTSSDGLYSNDATGFITDLYKNNNLGAAVVPAQPSSNYNDYKLVSYLGRINYNFKGKYYATFTGRYDGSSKFGRDNKFAFFPSAALSWNVSQEDFLKNSQQVTNLKLRLSYGAAGNQAINPYQTLATVSNTPVVFNNTQYNGFYPSSLDNAGLKWETTRQLDAGFDLGLVKDRVQVTADYYHKRTSDLLLQVNLPSSSGYNSVIQNVGVVQNQGFEFQVNSINLDGALTWKSGLNITSNRTKVLDLGKDAQGNKITYKEIGPGGNWFPTIVGQSMMQLYGYTVTGVYQTDQEAIDNGEPSKHAGDYKFKNWDGKGTVNDQDDRTVISHLEPKFTFGFNNNFSYKNFDLSILFVGSYGNDIVNEFRKYNITMNGKWAPTQEAFDNRWKGAGTGNSIDKPSANSGNSIRDYANSLWVEDGSYLRLRDITLGYTFSAKQLSFAKLSSIRVYVSAQNWLTITNYSGYDPEVSWAIPTINGWDRGNYPSTKSITVGAKVNF
ncbi:TonB-dependent receptor [Chitinophaga polysaccharea]|uniref:SusC/RagA family TonB-linked outer membrane protein n=1 Tax=Chitinophaga TaxID=79328 RepID=UPI0014558A7D|nr:MULTISPECIES: TonB-dependent receptor [Chitinophaga]NLR59139.1 TonB-dependent receptor [Chitinophaga polysaccharea]NLU92090.1 TonB-dependent receptor [Chitinophaga sp. Ak27]